MHRASSSRSIASPSVGRPLLRWSAIALAGATLVGCGTAPLSYLYDNQVYYRAVRDRYPLFVAAVDGSSPAFRPVPISPGEHVLTLEAPPVGGFSEQIRKTYPITIEACTRYYLAAQRQTQLSQDWELVVERTFPVGGCDPAVERGKAKNAAIAGRPAPTSSVIESVASLAASSAPTDRTR